MVAYHLGRDEVDRDASFAGLGTKGFERRLHRQASACRDDSLRLFDDHACVECRLQLANHIVAVTAHGCSFLCSRRGKDERIEGRHHQSQLRAIVAPEQTEQSRDAVTHRLGTQKDALTDLLVGHALRDERENLAVGCAEFAVRKQSMVGQPLFRCTPREVIERLT